MKTPRPVTLRIRVRDGREQVVTLGEDSPEVAALFSALANAGGESRFMQLPVDDGRVAFSFQTSQVVSIVSEPPVVLAFETGTDDGAREGQGAGHTRKVSRGARPRRPRFVVIDDFLSRREHDALLTHALGARTQFQGGGTNESEEEGRLVSLDLTRTFHGRLLENRLLIWFPVITKTLGLRMFALAPFEARLTAARDGDRARLQLGETTESSRGLACVYFLQREPRGFVGGELRFHDCVEDGGVRRAGESATTVAPVANRLVVFPGEEFHEVLPVRCPSGEFADSRFAVTTWFRSAARLDPHAKFGWGRFRCGVVAPQFAFAELAGTSWSP